MGIDSEVPVSAVDPSQGSNVGEGDTSSDCADAGEALGHTPKRAPHTPPSPALVLAPPATRQLNRSHADRLPSRGVLPSSTAAPPGSRGVADVDGKVDDPLVRVTDWLLSADLGDAEPDAPIFLVGNGTAGPTTLLADQSSPPPWPPHSGNRGSLHYDQSPQPPPHFQELHRHLAPALVAGPALTLVHPRAPFASSPTVVSMLQPPSREGRMSAAAVANGHDKHFGQLPSVSQPSSPAGAEDGSPPFLAASRRAARYCGTTSGDLQAQLPQPVLEEIEWDKRQRQTGAAGRMVIYAVGDLPTEDFLLRGGGERRVMVAAVTVGGKAALAGVKAGDVLVSINGSKDFQGMIAEDVRALLVPPVAVVFLGFVGKLEAEVRLKCKQDLAGLSSNMQVCAARPDVKVLEEVVFRTTGTALMLTTTSPNGTMAASASSGAQASAAETRPIQVDDGDCDGDDIIDIDTLEVVRRGRAPSPKAPPAVYELRGAEARRIINRALRCSEAPIPIESSSATKTLAERVAEATRQSTMEREKASQAGWVHGVVETTEVCGEGGCLRIMPCTPRTIHMPGTPRTS